MGVLDLVSSSINSHLHKLKLVLWSLFPTGQARKAAFISTLAELFLLPWPSRGLSQMKLRWT